MESFESSPNYIRARSSFDAKKDNSPGGSECDDMISVGSSTGGSAVNCNEIIKDTLKNFGKVRSFRRRAKPRIILSPIPVPKDDPLANSSHSSPHYLKATTSSDCKKSHSQTSPNGSDISPKSLRTLSRTSSLRSVRILIKKSSFKPRRSSLSHSKVSEDVNVDRATYSSTVKDSKFPEPVEVGIESEKSSGMKVCRYHHCSLHGHCQGNDDPVPPVKRFLYNRRRSLKKQKSVVPKTELRPRGKNSSDKKKNLHKSQMVPTVEPLNQETISDNKEKFDNQEVQLFGAGYKDIREAYVVDVAFGETSFPERSYEENLHILRKYSSGVGQNGHCLGCSCHNREEVRSISSTLDWSKDDNSDYRSADVSGANSAALFKNPNEASTEEKSSVFSSSLYRQTPSDSNSEEEAEFTTESTTAGDSKVNEAVQVEDSKADSSVQTGGKLQFSKSRHISMWHLIQQHMSTNASVEPVEGADGESTVDSGADSLLVKESTTSSRDYVPDSDIGGKGNDSENQEIEIRKLFAIKLVREAIEKILLPEIQDQTSSDDQSVTSEISPRPEIVEKNQIKVFDAESGEANSASNPKEESVTLDEAFQDEKQVVKRTEKKAPKHWSNLKKWILLQRFIRALEKVRKFNPSKPRILPLHPDPEAEKVNLRPQTVDERKNAEEWMLDYALRQAVSQLAPTQKRKVSLLVRAFETVVPPKEESQVQFVIPRLREKEIEMVNDERDNNGESLVKFQSSDEKSVVSSRSFTTMDELPELKEENRRETVGDHLDLREVQNDIIQGDAISNCINGDAKDSGERNQMDRKKHVKMWHEIYQHVVSGIVEKVGSHLLDGSEDDEAEENGAYNGFSQPSNLRGGLTKSGALKLVKEAVDEILVPEEIQDDSSDTRSVTSESVPDEDVSPRTCNGIGGEKNPSEVGKETKAESEVTKKNELPKAKNWRKLKKLLLLKRSIKALEKARESKQETNHLVPQDQHDPEPEKIDLRRQMVDERKKAEQWMLDYAVQHIVTKLTPARKRRVSMLVEAFEAVVPLPEV